MKIVWSVHLLGALGAKSDERPYKMFHVLLGSGEDAFSPGEDEYLAGIVAPLGDRPVVGFAFQLGIGHVRRLPGPFVLALEGIGFIVKVLSFSMLMAMPNRVMSCLTSWWVTWCMLRSSIVAW